MILTVGNLKGGVGKTTLAVNITMVLAQAKRDVLLIDAEGTALNFTNLRAATHGESGYTAVSLQGAAIRQQMKQLAPKYDDVVLDIGGEDASGSLRAAFTVSDIVLMPVKPRSFDLWRTEETLELVNAARQINDRLRAVAVLNEADSEGPDNEKTLAALAELEGLEIAPFVIRRRKAFPNAQARGLSVLEYRADPRAADDLRQLVAVLSPSFVYHNAIGA
jgi:chromosome partitioning protein